MNECTYFITLITPAILPKPSSFKYLAGSVVLTNSNHIFMKNLPYPVTGRSARYVARQHSKKEIAIVRKKWHNFLKRALHLTNYSAINCSMHYGNTKIAESVIHMAANCSLYFLNSETPPQNIFYLQLSAVCI